MLASARPTLSTSSASSTWSVGASTGLALLQLMAAFLVSLVVPLAIARQFSKSEYFQNAFLNETVWNPATSKHEIVSVGDDRWLTRYLYAQDWDIRIQYSDAGIIYTTIGDPKKFFGQCLRWMRTTMRENPKLLANQLIRRRFPWCVYAKYITDLFNFAVFWDSFLLSTMFAVVKDTK
jgi:hypothetical protein